MTDSNQIIAVVELIQTLDKKVERVFEFAADGQKKTLEVNLAKNGLMGVICNMLGHWAAADENPETVIDLILEPLLHMNLKDDATRAEIQHYQIERDRMHQMMKQTALDVANSLK